MTTQAPRPSQNVKDRKTKGVPRPTSKGLGKVKPKNL